MILNYDINYVNMKNIINDVKIISFCRLVVRGHLEGTMSQIFHLGLVNFFKNWQKVSHFLT